MTGNTDRPIDKIGDDLMNVSNYINGLSTFICTCDTPMTVAIQGDWGSGKTSFMNMTHECIAEKVECIWFNTWQFSQFSMGDNLPIILLKSLAQSIDVDQSNKNIKAKIGILSKMVLDAGSAVVSNYIGVNLKEQYESAISPTEEDVVQVIVGLKKTFEECVHNCLTQKKKDKLVIFIDDLDRLSPGRAVEIMEVIKLFLDCDRCVFVLAVDYEVVSQGISEKYGNQFDAKKGREFFDKIIQVPFKIPIAHYDMEKYIRQTLQNGGFQQENAKQYVNLIANSVGYNPRAIKRIMNAFLLLKLVYKDTDLNQIEKQLSLFAILCMQMSYEKVYNYIVMNSQDDITYELFQSLYNSDEENESKNEFMEVVKDLLGEEDVDEFKEFFQLFLKAIAGNQDTITDQTLQNFIELLQISGTTAGVAGIHEISNGKSGKGIRYAQTYEDEFNFRTLDEKIESITGKDLWRSCKIKGYSLFGKEEKPVKDFSDMVRNVLGELYALNPKAFLRVRENCETYKLYSLFYGSKMSGKLKAPHIIPGTNIEIETKNDYNTKVSFLQRILVALGYKCSDLKLNVKLARRKS